MLGHLGIIKIKIVLSIILFSMLMLFCTFISQKCGVLGMKNNEKMKTSRNHWYIYFGHEKNHALPLRTFGDIWGNLIERN